MPPEPLTPVGSVTVEPNPIEPETTEPEATEPTEETPRNRNIEENGVDLDALSDTSSTATGNRYPFSARAADNFARDQRQKANRLIQEAMEATKEADRWLDIASEARDAEARTEEERKKAEEERRRSEQKMDELLATFQRIADRMDTEQ